MYHRRRGAVHSIQDIIDSLLLSVSLAVAAVKYAEDTYKLISKLE